MKLVKQILFMLVLVAGLSVASMAQKGGDGQKPPKNPPPVINPGKPNPQPRETPKGGDKPKKPGMEAAIVREENEVA